MIEPQIEMIDTAAIVPCARNAKKHPQEQVAKIAGSIREFGFNSPVLIAKDKTIVAGHGRVLAAQMLGLERVPCVVLEHLDDIQRRAYMLADNRLGDTALAPWDVEMLSLEVQALEADGFDVGSIGFDELGLREIADSCGAGTGNDTKDAETEDTEPQIDRAEELRKEWNVETGQLWRLGEHRLLCGDSTRTEDVARVMAGEKADCVFTSPPYAVGIDYGETYKDTIENLRSMLGKLSVLWHDVIVAGGYAVTNFGDILSGREIAGSDEPCEYPMAIEYFPIFRAAKWALWSRRVWCKPGAACGSSRHCIGTNRAACNYEHVWTWKRAGKSIVDDQLAGEWPSQAGWFDTTHENKLGVGLKTHGAGMPPTVAARAVFWHSRSGAIVHEPFCGTGTTIIACEQLGRKCRAIEISPGYVAVALQRWSDHTGKTPELVK